jgi:hypothetical protein
MTHQDSHDPIDDTRLDALLADARQTWHAAPEPPLDEMWAEIEAAHFDSLSTTPAVPFRRGTPSWRALAMGIAAALVAGVGIGRWTALTSPTDAPALAVADPSVKKEPGPVSQATTEYIGETVALLTALPRDPASGAVSDAQFAAQAADLLSTTRLLLDSSAGDDPRLRALLEDLELVLAQVARLPAQRGGEELEIIRQALEQREVVSRLRVAAAAMSAGDD